MKIIISMAGLGNRFKEIGLKMPKYKIIANGKSLFEWSLLSLQDFFMYEFIFISREEIWDDDFVKDCCDKLGIANYKSVLLNEMTDGQATTVMHANGLISDDEAIAIYNIDTYIKPFSLKRSQIDVDIDGFIPVIKAVGDRWSFVKIDDDNYVTEVAEKKPISNLATVGLYYFKSWGEYKRIYDEMKNKIKKEYKEYYIAPMYTDIIHNKGKISIEILSNDDVSILGTPDEIESFDKNYLNNNL